MRIGSKKKLLSISVVVLCVLATVLLVACGTDEATPAASGDEESGGNVADFVGSAKVEPLSAPIGSSITVSGTGFPTGETLDIVWGTVEGSWDIRGDYNEEYHGRVFEDIKYKIASVETTSEGGFSTVLVVPEDYGFNHNITMEQAGQVLNRVGFAIEPTATITPTSGPAGTLITVTMVGVGWDRMENSWSLMYDNKFTGLLSAVTTGGTAEAIIPAAGGPGKHVLKILHGAYQYPYLNTEQNPRPDQPVLTMEFTITEGAVVLPPSAEDQGLEIEYGSAPAGAGTNAILWTDPASAPIETATTLQGSGFPAGKQVEFLWYSVVGNRVSGSGWDESTTELGTATVADDGSVSFDFAVPDDLGGPHRIEAIVEGDSVVETSFTVTASVLPLSVASGPAGTTVTVHLKGVGWTETANIYHLVYDNGYLGYACGFNSQGDITIYLPLTGEPGWHFIDLYPGIYKGQEAKGVQNFRIPQLTYEEDHPGERLPAFHLAVEITD